MSDSSQMNLSSSNADEKTFLGHPRGLMILFFSEMWERFCYYGMRVLLTLYLVKSLMKGDAEASLIYGAYTGLVYMAPVLGGRMADKILGYRFAIMLGAVLMSIGEFLILGGTDEWLLVGMGAIIIGNGYFKANISTIVGKLYKDEDPRRDSGFTIFYIGINVGALLATSVVAFVGETYGFHYGFALAGFGMLLALVIFWFGREQYKMADGLDITEEGKKKVLGPLNMAQLVTIISIVLIPVCYLLISYHEVLTYLLLAVFIYVSVNLIYAGIKEGVIWRDRMIALVIFIIINIVFWACFEQAGTSLTLFADRNVNREILGWTMPASMTQFFNPAFIIVFGSIFSVMWVKLSEMGKNPSLPMKFAYGILQLGIGFLIPLIGLSFESGFQVPLLTLVFLYLFHTTGELFLSPIGLSMVTKLSPKKIAGTAMGAWFLSFAIGNFTAGQIAALTGAESHGGEVVEVSAFNTETSVNDAIEMSGMDIKLSEWIELDAGMPININVGKYLELKDWVEFRKALDAGTDFLSWKSNRSSYSSVASAEEWLDKDKWMSLKEDYQKYNNDDREGEQIIDLSTWMYFRDGFDELDKDASLFEVYSEHKLDRMEKGLNKYVDIFSTIGYVLIGFALLLMILNRPLNKLMHGVS